MGNYYIIFHNVHDALAFEKALKDSPLKVELAPVPRELSSSCGITAKFADEDDNLKAVEEFIKEKKLKIKEICYLEKKGKSLL